MHGIMLNRSIDTRLKAQQISELPVYQVIFILEIKGFRTLLLKSRNVKIPEWVNRSLIFR